MGIARSFQLGNYSDCTLHHQCSITKRIQEESQPSWLIIPRPLYLVRWCCACCTDLWLQDWLSNCCSYCSSFACRQFWYNLKWTLDFDQRLLPEEIIMVWSQCLILDPHKWNEGSLGKGWLDHCLHSKCSKIEWINYIVRVLDRINSNIMHQQEP